MTHTIKYNEIRKESFMISLTLVVGFLGSGKTTLINQLIQSFPKKYAIIENEFGEMNIDEKILESDQQVVFDISDGCLCCSVKGDLVVNLKRILEKIEDVNHIFIEATGVAEPGPIVETLLASDFFKERFLLTSVISVIEKESFLKNRHGEFSNLFKSQLAFSDIIYFSKYWDHQIDQAKDFIKQINPQANFYDSVEGLDFNQNYLDHKWHVAKEIETYPFSTFYALSCGDDVKIEFKENTRGCFIPLANNHQTNIDESKKIFSYSAEKAQEELVELDHLYQFNAKTYQVDTENISEILLALGHPVDFELENAEVLSQHEFLKKSSLIMFLGSCSFEVEGEIDLEKFQLFLNYTMMQYGDNLLRCKGIINVSKERSLLFQGVYNAFDIKLFEGERPLKSQFVFIGKHLRSEVLEQGLLNCRKDSL